MAAVSSFKENNTAAMTSGHGAVTSRYDANQGFPKSELVVPSTNSAEMKDHLF